MGAMMVAICENCGFQNEFFYGAGMMDFKTVCNVPAMNKKTGKFLVKNYRSKAKLKDIVFYTQKEMYEGSIEDGFHYWDEVKIKQELNLCPQCSLFELSFVQVGLFD